MEAFRAQSRRHRSSSSSSSSREVGDKGSAGSKAGGKGGDSTHGGVTGGGGAPSPAASVAAATSADMPATAAAAALEKKRCETCGDAHVDEDCWLLAMTLQQSIDDARVAKNIAQVIPIGVSAEHGCICEGSEVATKDVPGDGNCLFHALWAELLAEHLREPCLPANLAALFANMPSPAAASRNGHLLRQWYLRYVASTRDMIEEMSVQEWIAVSTGTSAQEYIARMKQKSGSGLGRAQWGGYLDIFLICHACRGGHIMCIVLQAMAGGRYRVVALAGVLEERARVICVAWTGNRWVRARLSRKGHERVREWRHRA